jgi:hypothetical protein
MKCDYAGERLGIVVVGKTMDERSVVRSGRLQLSPKSIRIPPVIGIKERKPDAAGSSRTKIPRRRRSPVRFLHDGYQRRNQRSDFRGPVLGPIVDHNYLDGPYRLRKHALNRTKDGRLGIERRNNDAYRLEHSFIYIFRHELQLKQK